MLASKSFFRYFDWLNFILIITLSCIGLLFVYSATYTAEQPCSLFFKKQAVGLVIAIAIYFVCIIIDYRTLLRWGYFGYGALIGLLIFTLIKGSIGMGAQRWINLIFFKLQPSELCKLLFPAFATYHIQLHKDNLYVSYKDFLPIIAILAISFILILKQPDLGTAFIVTFSGLIFLWLAGLPKKWFIYGFLFVAITTPALWHLLKPYQKNRIAVFFGQGNIQKERYQIEQATIAIGSGGLTGKGLLNGTQNKLRFLPESRTDFIFAVLCEEWGFLGALAILLMYAFLFLRSFALIQSIASPYLQLLAIALLMHLILSALINISMVAGLLPIVGIPLPLMSYGLSNLWISFASLGWIQGIIMQQLEIGNYQDIHPVKGYT